MEKINDCNLSKVAHLALESIKTQLRKSSRDLGLEISLFSSPIQETFILNLFDELALTLKIFPHKNVLREGVFRCEVYMAKGGEMRGQRIASVELQETKEHQLEGDIGLFLKGILSRAGIKS